MLVDDFTLIKSLGKGAFGEVFLTRKQGSKEIFIIKQIEKQYINNPKSKKYIDREIEILKDINHVNIVKLYDVKEANQNFYLITEYYNGGKVEDCLEKYQIEHNVPFPEELVQYLMRQIISAVKYLHDKRIMHRHISLDNIILHYDKEEDRIKRNLMKAKVKIIDFGFARYLKKGELAKSTLGAPINMDPGILRKLNKLEHSKEYSYDEKVDIWGLGNIFYEMLNGKSVFDAEDMDELVSKVEKGNYFLPSTLSIEAASFLNGMLKYDPTKRFTADKLYRHPFLTKNIKDFHKINLNKIKENVIDSKIKMNTKLNESIWDIPPEGYYNGILKGYEYYIEEKETIKKNEVKNKNDNRRNNGDENTRRNF